MISVIASSYNQLPALIRFMESMARQSPADFEVVVADDGSDDGTVDWLVQSRHPFPLLWVTQPHSGFRLAAAWNHGARVARGNRLLFTNGDTEHCPGSVAAHSALPMDRMGIGIVIFEDGRTNRRPGAAQRSHAWGGNLSVPSPAFRRAGGFDEAFERWGGEDADLAERIQDAIPVWVADSTAVHQGHPPRDWHPPERRARCKSSP